MEPVSNQSGVYICVGAYHEMGIAIGIRAQHIGRLLRQHKHFTINPKISNVPMFSAVYGGYTNGQARIIIGLSYEDQNAVTVLMPERLFDRGTDEEIIAWIRADNQAFEEEMNAAREEVQQAALEAKREEELSILRELSQKYPEETRLLV